MARNTFFSFKYEDVARAMVVRHSWLTKDRSARGFIDSADFETLERRGDDAIKAWINAQLVGTSVTVVLVGAATNRSRWVRYEVEASLARGNGVIGVDVANINDLQKRTTTTCGPYPSGVAYYWWYADKGYENLGSWIETAAIEADR